MHEESLTIFCRLHIDVLGEILRVLRVFEVGKRKAVHRCARALIQLRQSVTVTTGNAEEQSLQFAALLRRQSGRKRWNCSTDMAWSR